MQMNTLWGRAGMLALAMSWAPVAPPATPIRALVAPPPTRAAKSRMPFTVGEHLTYQAKVNFLNAGTATMTVEGIDTVRGHDAYHTVFDLNGGLLFFKIHNHYESWFDTASFNSLRLIQNSEERGKTDNRTYEFYPKRQVYVKNGEEEKPSVADPLDESSFLYFMRTVPLEVGKTYSFDRYYHPDRNPVIIKVLRREHISVPAGEFDAVVVQPIIKSRGLFSEGGQAEVWFSDDSTHKILQLKSKLSFGTLYLQLRSVEYASRR